MLRRVPRSARAHRHSRAPPPATALPLPRPRHKPLRERTVYETIASAAASAMAARTTFATTGVSEAPPPVQPSVPAATVEVPVTPVVALETEEPRRKRGERISEEGVAAGEERAEEVEPAVQTFLLSYALLLALTAFGLGIAGGATNFWVVRRALRCACDVHSACFALSACACLRIGARGGWAWAMRLRCAARSGAASALRAVRALLIG